MCLVIVNHNVSNRGESEVREQSATVTSRAVQSNGCSCVLCCTVALCAQKEYAQYTACVFGCTVVFYGLKDRGCS